MIASGQPAAPSDARIAAAAIGFDLGETLYHYGSAPLSWLERARPAIDRVVIACGVDRSKTDVAAAHTKMASYSDYLRRRIEKVSAEDVMTEVLARIGGGSARRLETAVDSSLSFLRRSLEAYPDAAGTLAALKEAGFVVGALSNVPFGMPRRTIRRDLVRSGLAPYLDGFVTSVDVGLRKPHRATFEWLAATLGVELEELAYVGNLPTDVTGARACGCVPIYLDRTHSGLDFGQAATVHHLHEISPLLTRIPRR
ncbi:MAG TPA: HAD family hydrolase [Thermoleophilia bacterium]|nr:HAD family hydrolase [Thermoleophilia bacterium]